MWSEFETSDLKVENKLIKCLIVIVETFPKGGKKLDYDLFPEATEWSDGWNSNSFVRGLINAVPNRLRTPLFPGAFGRISLAGLRRCRNATTMVDDQTY